MEEIWTTIEDFPLYLISDCGRVMNVETRHILKETVNPAGIVKVGLVAYAGKQHQRSIKVLVAQNFVDGRTTIFNTPMQLDGNPYNNRADNIVWRPRWFAWKYKRQFAEISALHTKGPIVDKESGDCYTDVFEAATRNGLLVSDLYLAIQREAPTFPTWQSFKLG